MDTSASVILATAAAVAFGHTLIGVDHSLPFVVLGRARGWSLRRTLWITTLCGGAHVASSVLLGLLGIGLGVALERLEWLEAARGELAAWLLIAFGLTYAVWALWRGRRAHGMACVHHGAEHEGRTLTFWALFLVFAFGPCEPLIPLMMAPAVAHAWWLVAAVAAVFGLVTVGTMLGVVALGSLGLRFAWVRGLERHADALAGLAIAASGVAIRALGI